MRTALVLAVLLVPVVAAQDVEFSVPAALDGALRLEGLSRVVVVVPPGDGAALAVELANATGTATNRTLTVTTVHQPTLGRFDVPTPESETTQQAGGLQRLVATDAWASVYLEGDLQVTIQGRAALAGKPDGQGMEAFLGGNVEEGYHVRLHALPDREPYVVAQPMEVAGYTITATRLERIEWSGVQATCAASCPDGGGQRATQRSLPSGSVTEKSWSFIELETTVPLQAHGTGAFLLLGGKAPDLALRGAVRLPVASTLACASCVQAENQTLAASGNVTLAGIRDLGGGRMRAGFAADGALHLDESPIDVGTTAAVAGAVAVAVVAWKLVAALLFSRHVPDALKNERRAKLHGVVVANPGATFREVAAKAGLAPGVARHHLRVLARAGLVVERPHGSTVRFFENHGKYDAAWRDLVVLRDANLRALHDWLALHPGALQGEVVAAMQHRHGWTRSTTQHRLGKLVGGGLAASNRDGRHLAYWCLAPGAPLRPPAA